MMRKRNDASFDTKNGIDPFARFQTNSRIQRLETFMSWHHRTVTSAAAE